jgi:outer membrane protein OmpA-like peptidoglycan-associated protein
VLALNSDYHIEITVNFQTEDRKERPTMSITRGCLIALFILAQTGLGAAETLGLNVIRFDDRREVKFNMLPTRRVANAAMEGRVRFRDGQFWIELRYQRMKPAVLFGGDVTCYVLWAVNRDGAPQNLGELWIRPGEENGSVQYSTGLRNFALLVTAESYYQVDRPSELFIFWNDASPDPPVPVDPLTYTEFTAAPRIGVETLANVRYDGRKPLDLVQAEMVFEQAKRMEVQKYAPDLFAQATVALEQATQMYERDRRRGAGEYARRSVAATNEAIRTADRRREVERIEALLIERRQEMAALEERADQAEKEAQQAQTQVQEAQAALRQTTAEREQAMASVQTMTQQLEAMRGERAELESRLSQLRTSMQELRVEKSTLEDRLQGALSLVAETRESARGLIVNLPDILFAVGEANLKPEAQIVLAKLAGILLIMQDLNLRIEGHTDSTGSASFNQRLSEQRADAVFDLLARQGVSASRMKTAGYGLERPIADNNSHAGRQQNRRVEIVIAEGVVRESAY